MLSLPGVAVVIIRCPDALQFVSIRLGLKWRFLLFIPPAAIRLGHVVIGWLS